MQLNLNYTDVYEEFCINIQFLDMIFNLAILELFQILPLLQWGNAWFEYLFSSVFNLKQWHGKMANFSLVLSFCRCTWMSRLQCLSFSLSYGATTVIWVISWIVELVPYCKLRFFMWEKLCFATSHK